MKSVLLIGQGRKIKTLKCKVLLLITLPLLISILQAGSFEDTFVPEWTVNCHQGHHKFSISVLSKSGQATEDDMEMTAMINEHKVPLPLREALYVRRGISTDLKSSCKGVAALPIPEEKVLLFLSSDDRPLRDQLNLVLVDLKDGVILDVKEKVGAILGSGGLVIRRHNKDFEVRLERKSLEDKNSEIYISVDDWMSVAVVANKIVTKWSRSP